MGEIFMIGEQINQFASFSMDFCSLKNIVCRVEQREKWKQLFLKKIPNHCLCFCFQIFCLSIVRGKILNVIEIREKKKKNGDFTITESHTNDDVENNFAAKNAAERVQQSGAR